MASITLDSVEKVFPGGQTAVAGVSLEIANGELAVLVGPSGCGKSTVLRLIAGLESPTSGRVLIDGQDVTRVPAERRDLAMVFQHYALYPHLTVRDNLAFGLRMRRVPPGEAAERVDRVARSLGIEGLLERKPAALSGGQRQRVALGRAIVREPRGFLFDEPLSNLDPALRVDTRAELARLHKRLTATMVYVTHDQEEAMVLGTRIAVMRSGRLEQVGPPLDVFRRPASTFVARFIGAPAMNLIPCEAVPSSAGVRVASGPLSIDLERAGAGWPRSLLLGVRAQDVNLAPAGAADLRGRVEVVEAAGTATLLHVRVEGLGEPVLRVAAPPDRDVSGGALVGLTLDRERLHAFDASSGRRLD